MRVVSILALGALLAGCSIGTDPGRESIGLDGPDEFSVVPNRPLATPGDMTALPPPTPNGANRADQTPQADAIAALGGNAAAGGTAVEGPALIDYVGRYGTEADIRGTVAAEDQTVRDRGAGRVLERVFNTDTYSQVYGNQRLDPEGEIERLRGQGVRVPQLPAE